MPIKPDAGLLSNDRGGLNDDHLRGWLESAAGALAARLRAGEVPRGRRREAREALGESFEALEADAMALELVRRVDGLATQRMVSGMKARIGVEFARGALDWRLLTQLWRREAVYDGIERRVERFLAVTGAGGAVGETRDATPVHYPEVERTLTEG